MGQLMGGEEPTVAVSKRPTLAETTLQTYERLSGTLAELRRVEAALVPSGEASLLEDSTSDREDGIGTGIDLVDIQTRNIQRVTENIRTQLLI